MYIAYIFSLSFVHFFCYFASLIKKIKINEEWTEEKKRIHWRKNEKCKQNYLFRSSLFVCLVFFFLFCGFCVFCSVNNTMNFLKPVPMRFNLKMRNFRWISFNLKIVCYFDLKTSSSCHKPNRFYSIKQEEQDLYVTDKKKRFFFCFG